MRLASNTPALGLDQKHQEWSENTYVHPPSSSCMPTHLSCCSCGHFVQCVPTATPSSMPAYGTVLQTALRVARVLKIKPHLSSRKCLIIKLTELAKLH